MSRIKRYTRWILAGLVIVLLAGSVLFSVLFAALAFTPLGNLATDFLADSTGRVMEIEPAEFIVVLGGDVQRVVDGARLFRAGKAETVILSGGYDDHLSALTICGVHQKNILHDDTAQRTADHPVTILKLPGVEYTDPLILVTSGCHAWRARHLFTTAGYEEIQVFEYRPPDRSRQTGAGLKGAIEIIYECLAIVKDAGC